MKRNRALSLAALSALAAALALFAPLAPGQGAPAPAASHVDRLDPAVNAIVPADAKVEKVAGNFGFVEGPVWVRSGGYLLFSDIPANVIDKWTPDGKVTVFLDKSGFSGTDTSGITKMQVGSASLTLGGSNGITYDKQGRITYCQHGNRAIERLEKDGKRTVLASRYEGKRLNSPNDLVYRSDGSLYFTDPPFALPKGDQDPAKEVAYDGVYRWSSNGKLELVAKDFKGPNGIAFSPDGKYLYVNDSTAMTYTRFDVKPDGSLANGKIFVDMSKVKGDGVPDGMKVDRQGNIYGTGPGGVWIITPQGKHLGTIVVPEIPANLAWGDADGKTLYMTARTGLYRIRLNIEGVRP